MVPLGASGGHQGETFSTPSKKGGPSALSSSPPMTGRATRNVAEGRKKETRGRKRRFKKKKRKARKKTKNEEKKKTKLKKKRKRRRAVNLVKYARFYGSR